MVTSVITKMISSSFKLISLTIKLISIIIKIIFKYLKNQHEQDKTITPLEMMDAKKLDGMLAQQIESALQVYLSNNGYTNAKIKQILIRNPIQKPSFRR